MLRARPLKHITRTWINAFDFDSEFGARGDDRNINVDIILTIYYIGVLNS